MSAILLLTLAQRCTVDWASDLKHKGHNSDQENQSASDLFHLSPATKATATPTKGFDTSSNRMPSIRKRPRFVMSITKPTALKLILDPPDRLCVLFREQCNPLTLQAADQLARRRHVSES